MSRPSFAQAAPAASARSNVRAKLACVAVLVCGLTARSKLALEIRVLTTGRMLFTKVAMIVSRCMGSLALNLAR
jgi:hypothetical protein